MLDRLQVTEVVLMIYAANPQRVAEVGHPPSSKRSRASVFPWLRAWNRSCRPRKVIIRRAGHSSPPA
jgi:hypothetical protein